MARHVLLNNVEHQNTKVISQFSEAYGDNIASTQVFATEFIELQKEYPILFRRDEENDSYFAVAQFGMQQGENLYLDASKASGWNANYIPANVERGPFLIGFQRQQDPNQQATPVIHIDMEHPKVNEAEGQPLFKSHGGNSEYLEHVSEKLQAIHHGMNFNKPMFDAFSQLELIEPINIEFELHNGEKHRLVGYHTINEEKLRGLNGEQLESLHKAGFLQLAFAVVASITNIRRLINIKNQRAV